MWTFQYGIAWAFVLLGVTSAAAQSPDERTRLALDMVLAGKYEPFYAQFSPEMKKAISLATYAEQVGRLTRALGKPFSQDSPQVRHIGDAVTVAIPVHWASTTLNFIVSWNAAGQIQGTWFRPPEPKAVPYETPTSSRVDSFSSRDITIGDDQWKLPGTLTVPKGKGPFPAVVLVHGSGPNDRDESVGGVRVFRDLAEGLSSRGVAVLRYDKRTKVHPQECAADPNFTMSRETVEDAVRAAALLRKQDGIDPRRVFVLGHSQGGYMAPRIMQADPSLAGVIVMAGSVRPLEESIVEQFAYIFSLKGEPTAAQSAQLEAIRKDPWTVLPGAGEKYKADLKDYHPAALAAESSVPMLILQGGRDYQVRMKDFELWKAGLAGRKGVTMHSYPKLNHLFVTGDGKSTPEEYSQPGHVAPEVIDDIAAWTTVPQAGQ
jgi:dienelactone hydrolase